MRSVHVAPPSLLRRIPPRRSSNVSIPLGARVTETIPSVKMRVQLAPPSVVRSRAPTHAIESAVAAETASSETGQFVAAIFDHVVPPSVERNKSPGEENPNTVTPSGAAEMSPAGPPGMDEKPAPSQRNRSGGDD